jgi:hypothetical protein
MTDAVNQSFIAAVIYFLGYYAFILIAVSALVSFFLGAIRKLLR